MMFVSSTEITNPPDSKSKEELFRITRNKDANEIIYYLNTTSNDQLDLNAPVEAYWIRYNYKGEQSGRPLNGIEKRYAYGLRFLSVTKTSAHFQFVSIDRDLYLKRTDRGDFVLVDIDGKLQRLEKIHLIIGKGSFWVPEISALELHGTDVQGNAVVEVINNPRAK